MAEVGSRAAFLLGMLYRPMTVQELHEMIGKGVGRAGDLEFIDELLPMDGPIAGYLQQMWEDGPAEIARHMIRLERAGLAERAGGGPDAGLWFRT